MSATDNRIGRYFLPWVLGKDLWQHRALIGQFAVREVQGRYRGTMLGVLWSFVTPLAMLAMYTLVFGGVFKASWPGLEDRFGGLLAFAVAMFAGSSAFSIFAEPTGRAASLIVGVPNYVKKVVFPLQVLPVAVLLTALFHAAVAFFLVIVGTVLILGHLPLTLLLLPVVIIPAALVGLGATWFLASLGVYLRDTNQTVNVVLQVLFFASPIVYPVEFVHEKYRWLLYLNPLTYCINIVRDTVVLGRWPEGQALVLAFVSGLLVAQLGYVWFMLTKRGFSDAL